MDVGQAIGVTRQHKALLDYVAQDVHSTAFDVLTEAQKLTVRADAEERYISYAFLRQSATQHVNLKVNLQNDYTTGDNHYPKTRQQTLHLLDKYTKTAVPRTTPSEGLSFAQKEKERKRKAGMDKKDKETFDKKYWKDKECYKCHKKGHPASHCENTGDDDDKSVSSATSKSVSKLKKDFKKMMKAFAQLKEEESELTESDSDEETSHLQFQFIQLNHKFEPQISKLFNQAHSSKINLDLREVILLDSQSTIDLLCNEALVDKISKSSSTMRLMSNGGPMAVSHKATLPGYHQSVRFHKKAIANINAMRNLITQYRVTYDSDDLMFVVHRESENKPDMEFLDKV